MIVHISVADIFCVVVFVVAMIYIALINHKK